MGARALRTLVEGGAYFEGPRWHDGRWWVSDFYRHGVFAITPEGDEELVLEVAGQPSGLGWLPDGSLLVVSMKTHELLRRAPDGSVSVHADLTEHCAGHLNDLVVDELGRAYAGNFGFDLMNFADPAGTSLVRVDPDGSVHVEAGRPLVPQRDGDRRRHADRGGDVRGPDDRVLDRRRRRAGRPARVGPDRADRRRPRRCRRCCRTWASRPTAAAWTPRATCGSPTGSAARPAGSRPAARSSSELALPEGLAAFACMLGGEDGRTLLLCAAPDFIEANRKDTREAVLLTTTVDVPHRGRP